MDQRESLLLQLSVSVVNLVLQLAFHAVLTNPDREWEEPEAVIGQRRRRRRGLQLPVRRSHVHLRESPVLFINMLLGGS